MAEARSGRAAAWRAGAVAATIVAAAALALVIAYWTWMLVGPAPVHIAPAVPTNPAATIVAGQLFGASARESTAPAGAATDTFADVRLLGIVARRDGAGYALFRLPSGARFVATGDDVTPGLRLVAVANDAVTLRDASGERTLALRPPFARAAAAGASGNPNVATGGVRVAPVTPPAPTPGAALASGAAKCNPPPGFKGDVVRLNVELVGGLIAQPETWRAMVEPIDGALVVRETAGFGQMIGLQQGDRVEQANGIALTVPDDVVGAVLRPLASNQPVRLSGKRHGQPRELWIANAGCVG